MRAVLYLRVSTQEQVSNLSLDTQEKTCRAYADRAGMFVAKVFREEGESAKTANRTQLSAMLAYLAGERRCIGAVICYRLDRLSRDRDDFYALRAAFQRLGVRLHSTSERLEETPEGVIVEAFGVAFAQVDNMIRSARTKAGMREALARGRWPWQAPLGYLNEPGTCVLDPGKAPPLRRAFERASTGLYSIPQLLAELSASALRIPRATLHRVLRNPFYAGRLIVPGWGIDVAGTHEPLVDWRTFRRACGQESPRRSYVTGATESFPFRQITRCECGRPLAGYLASGRISRHPYYRCQPCGMNVAAAKVASGFAAMLERSASSARTVDLFMEQVRAKIHAAGAARHEFALAATRRAGATKKKIERLTEAYLYEQAIDRDTYQREQAKLSTMLHDLESEASATVPPPETFEPALRFGRELLQTPIAAWSRVPDRHRPTFLRAVFEDGLTWELQMRFRTPTNSLLSLNLMADEGEKISSGTRSETNFENIPAPLAWIQRVSTLVSLTA